jgi:hypothetical protein
MRIINKAKKNKDVGKGLSYNKSVSLTIMRPANSSGPEGIRDTGDFFEPLGPYGYKNS